MVSTEQHNIGRYLSAIGKKYPLAWRQIDGFRASKGVDLPNWPDWCFIPMAGPYAVVDDVGGGRVGLDRIGDVSILAALSAWRVTQSVYRFDEALYECLLHTPVSGDMPLSAFFRLPEWCVYVETPGRTWFSAPLAGFFAHMEFDANTGREELRLLLDTSDGLAPLSIHLGAYPLLEGISQALDLAKVHRVASGMAVENETGLSEMILEQSMPLVSLLLYLCADEADFGDELHKPSNPVPQKTKNGLRLFPNERGTVWHVGARIGTTLRWACESRSAGGDDGNGNKKRAHIRRAHWHVFLVGAGRNARRVKWLPPILVNVDDPDDLPVTVRPVQE